MIEPGDTEQIRANQAEANAHPKQGQYLGEAQDPRWASLDKSWESPTHPQISMVLTIPGPHTGPAR